MLTKERKKRKNVEISWQVLVRIKDLKEYKRWIGEHTIRSSMYYRRIELKKPHNYSRIKDKDARVKKQGCSNTLSFAEKERREEKRKRMKERGVEGSRIENLVKTIGRCCLRYPCLP